MFRSLVLFAFFVAVAIDYATAAASMQIVPEGKSGHCKITDNPTITDLKVGESVRVADDVCSQMTCSKNGNQFMLQTLGCGVIAGAEKCTFDNTAPYPECCTPVC